MVPVRHPSLRPRPLFVLVAGLLLGGVLFMATNPGLLPGPREADARSKDPAVVFEAAVEDFRNGEYRAARDALRGLEQAPEGVEPRRFRWLRAAATLRQAEREAEPSAERRTEARQELERLALEPRDAWGARAYAELVRSRDAATLPGPIEPVLDFWERRTDIEAAIPGYADLARALLGSRPSHRGATAHRATLERIWSNLVSASAPDTLIEDLGVRLLGIRSGPTPDLRGGAVAIGGEGDLEARVARDLLRRTDDPWVRAHAALVAGRVAQRRGDLVAAVGYYERAVDAVDVADGLVAREARRRLTELRSPAIELTGNELFRPGSHHRLGLHWRNLAGWDLELRRIDLDDDLRPVSELGSASRLHELIVADAGEVVWSRRTDDAVEQRAREDGPARRQRHQRRSEAQWIDPLDPGVYVLVARGRVFDGDRAPEPERLAFVVSALGVLDRAYRPAGRDDTVRELWAVDMSRGEPVAGVELDVARGSWERGGNARRMVWRSERVRTADDGRAFVSVGDHARAMIVHGEHGGHPILFAGYPHGRGWTAPARSFRSLLWTDRPLYRPGETVHLQGFVRELAVRARRVDVPAGDRARVTIVDPNGEVQLERTVTLDDNGSFELDHRVPASAMLGNHRVQVVATDDGQWSDAAMFEVGEVRLPEFTVDVALDRERRYVLGDTLEVDVEAAYLFGGPVAGDVRVTVTKRPVFEIPWPWPQPRWRPIEPTGSASRLRIMPPGGSQGETVLEERLVLDDEGRATLRVPTDPDDTTDRSLRYRIEATVTDVSRRQERGSGTVTIGHTELTARLAPERSVVAPGDRAAVRLRIVDAMQRGVAHEGTWELRRRDEDGTERSLMQRTIRTDDDGHATIDFEPERTGRYRVVFRGVDGRGYEMEAETTVYVADPRTRDIPSVDSAVQLIVEQPEVLGDVARVLLLSETPGASVLLSRVHAGGTEAEVVRLNGTSRLLEIELDDRHRPEFEIQATRVGDFRVHRASVTVVAPPASKLLDLELEFAGEHFAPGTDASLRVKALDANGDPVSTTFSIAVVDQALLEVAPRPRLDPLQELRAFPRERAAVPQSMAARHGGYVELEPGDEDEEVADIGQKGGGMQRRGTRMMEASAAPDAFDVRVARSVADDVGAAEPFTPASVRTDFRTTVLWRTGVTTDADGEATVDVPLAESLTQWNAFVLAVDPQTRVGTAKTTTRTRKPMMVRLQHPRVFRADDRFTVAAIVHNETDTETKAAVQLEVERLTNGPRVESVLVPAHGQARVDFDLGVPFELGSFELVRDEQGRITGVEPGAVDVQVAVRSEQGEDAMRRTVELLPFGTGLHVASVREVGPGRASMSFPSIDERLPGSEVVTLTVAPTMLSAAIDALPALADYPYGCVEQTLSRFVPAVAVRAVVERLGVRSDRFDPELDARIADGLDRIAALQNGQGGWSWWGGRDRPTHPYVTAHVLVALAEAEDAGVDVDREVLRRGREALRAEISRIESRSDDLSYALVALARADVALHGDARPDDAMRRWANDLLDRRDELTPYARALTAIALHHFGASDRAATLLRTLENDVRLDPDVDTAHWGVTSNYWWRGRGAVETTSFALQAMVEIDPDHPRRDAVARWLVLNRRGHQWDSTRSSAHALYALCDHLRGSDELTPDYTFVARQDGDELVRVRVRPDEVVDGGGRFALPAAVLDGGALELELEGTGRAYVTYEADAFSRAREIEAAGNVVRIEREVVRLDPRRTLGAGVVDFEVPLDDGDTVRSGDRLRVRLRLDLDHDVDFLIVEDPRPAGAEPLEQRSGFTSFGRTSGHREVRDDRTAFFLDALSEGEHVIEYELVAESPGVFHVAPARAMAMYLPDVAGHSTRTSLEIVPKPDRSTAQ